METYFKKIDGDYITAIGTGSDGEEITQEEYESILSVIHNRPTPEVGYDYRLKTNLTWESVELPPELDDAQHEYERNLLAEYKKELAELDAALLDAQYQNIIGGI